jgi:hypothetical protein
VRGEEDFRGAASKLIADFDAPLVVRRRGSGQAQHVSAYSRLTVVGKLVVDAAEEDGSQVLRHFQVNSGLTEVLKKG